MHLQETTWLNDWPAPVPLVATKPTYLIKNALSRNTQRRIYIQDAHVSNSAAVLNSPQYLAGMYNLMLVCLFTSPPSELHMLCITPCTATSLKSAFSMRHSKLHSPVLNLIALHTQCKFKRTGEANGAHTVPHYEQLVAPQHLPLKICQDEAPRRTA